MASHGDDDVAAIRALVLRQFRSISWTADRSSDWASFANDFAPGATLVPAARPIATMPVEAFIERMKRVAAEGLTSLEETLHGTEIRVFGNIAVAMAVCDISENGAEPSRGVEAILLVKDQDRWRIVAQAWDMEAPGKSVPPDLLDEH